jgi:DNA polymerase-1
LESLFQLGILVVYLIDSHSLLYQVFHAVPMMTGPAGQPTNAIFGFANDMNRLRKRKPDYLICVFDPPGPTFRDTLYDDYKAHRSPMPDDLYGQLQGIRKLLEAMRIPAVEVKGFEADDVMATLAVAFAEQGHEVAICTSDKDCRQLINDKIHLYNARKDMMFGAKELKDDWGITPEQVVELLTLTGDSVDNVPGIPGIGVKTASKLLQEYHTVEGILTALPAMKQSKMKENLIEHQKVLELSRKLVKLDCHVDITIAWEDWKLKEPDAKTLLSYYTELGFNRLATELRAEVAKKMEKSKKQRMLFDMGDDDDEEIVIDKTGLFLEEEQWQGTYELVDTPLKLTDMMTALRQQSRFAIDFITQEENPRHSELVGIAISWEEKTGHYLPLRGPEKQKKLDEPDVLKKLKPLLEDASISKVGHNIKFEMAWLHQLGINMQGVAGDAMLASYLLQAGERSHSLADLARRHLNHSPMPLSKLAGEGKFARRVETINTAELAQHFGEEIDITLRLCNLLDKELVEKKLEPIYRNLELPLIGVLMEMEETGICLDVQLLKDLSREYTVLSKKLEEDIFRLAGRSFNIDSPMQLREILFVELKLPKGKKTAQTGEASTNQEVLEDLAAEGHELPKLIIAYRQLTKLQGTYLDALPAQVDVRTHRIHCQFNQTVAATGRLSSTNPNLQNIPMRTDQGRVIRKAFVAGEGYTLITADYSQIELRVFAHLSEDAALLQAFRENRDIHSFVAAQVFGIAEADVSSDQRRLAKVVNFGVLYGLSPYGLSNTLGISKDEAASFIDGYFAKYPGVVAFQDAVLADAKAKGYVTTIAGRRREITGIRAKSSYKMRNQAEREAVNTVIQGSAADLMKFAMLNIHRRIKKEVLPVRLLLQIHDELVLEALPDQLQPIMAMVKEEMINAIPLKVPVDVDISSGPNWLETE